MPPESRKTLLAYTPMLHARIFAETARYRDTNFQPTRAGLESRPNWSSATSGLYLDGNPSIDRPLFVQFCANSPEMFLDAARYVEPFCDAIDLNLGCPQGIARKGRYGAFLQEDWGLIYNLINKLHENLTVPVTAKVRILETKEKTLEYVKVILSAGASIITVHGRQRDQKGHKTGLADWSVIRYLRENLPRETVIFANGNILQHDDIEQCLEQTGADAVMSAEANLCDPTIFSSPPAVGNHSGEYWRGQNNKGGYRMDAVFRRYMDILYQYVLEQPSPYRKPLFQTSDYVDKSSTVLEDTGAGLDSIHLTDQRDHGEVQKNSNTGYGAKHDPHPNRNRSKKTGTTSANLLVMQAHLFQLLRPLLSKHTNIRDALASCRAGDMAAFENVLSLVEEVVREGIIDYESDPFKYDGDPIEQAINGSHTSNESSAAAVERCKRPWWVCQPHIRPSPTEALEKGSLQLSKKERLRNDIMNRDLSKGDALEAEKPYIEMPEVT